MTRRYHAATPRSAAPQLARVITLLACAFAPLFGCGGEPLPSAKSAPRTKTPEPAARPLLARAQALSAFGAAFISEQHFGAAGTSELRLGQAVRDAYTASEALPAASEVALVWTPRGGKANDALVLWMTKTDAGFRYALERPDGTSGTADELARCARCHAEAPSDELFRVPPPSVSETTAAK